MSLQYVKAREARCVQFNSAKSWETAIAHYVFVRMEAMHSYQQPAALYSPSMEELARQKFVLALKVFANGVAQLRVRAQFRDVVQPQLAESLGEAPAQRSQVEVPLRQSTPFRHWAVLAHYTQSMMWRSIETTTQRVAAEGQRRFAALTAMSDLRGSLHLDPTLEVPTPIANCEIHRQPGGYVAEASCDDLRAGLRYVGASAIYGPGKGNAVEGTDARGAFVVEQVRARFPSLRPRRILELGCGVGIASQTLARAFPQAEYHAIDVAPGLLRLGHLLATERGTPIHFYQRDAAHSGFPDAHFDLVVSNIFFHETNSARLPQSLREARRVLAPGGAMLHTDVPYQIDHIGLAEQVMNHWQVQWNGEPFWSAFGQYDMCAEIIAAGFDVERSFAQYIGPPGSSESFVFGASLAS